MFLRFLTSSFSISKTQAVTLITSLHKQKQTQESYVSKARDKYEQDCIKINGYTAQSSLVQGRDLDKVTGKLDKAQSTVASNDKDYQNFVRALKDTTRKWNEEWKTYLDGCQDIEEERLDFMKAKAWDYANAVSAVCVADDEVSVLIGREARKRGSGLRVRAQALSLFSDIQPCFSSFLLAQSSERVRVALENCESSRDIELFIQHAGTGASIPGEFFFQLMYECFFGPQR